MKAVSVMVLFALLTSSLLAQPPCASVNANAASADWHVDVNAPNPPGTGTKSDPYSTIGAAFNVADDNDRIFVAPGTYDLTNAGETYPYQWGSNAVLSQLGIQIIGTAGAAATILDGEGMVTSGFGIMRFRRLAAGAKIRGFTFRGYAGTLGAVRLGSTTSMFEAYNVEISHCIFEGSAPGSGIATFGASARLSIHDNVFLNNNDNGMWCSDITGNVNPCGPEPSGGEVYNNTFVGNGNGIRLQGGAWLVYNNVIVNSTANGIFDFGLAGFPSASFSYTLDNNCVFGNGTDYGMGTAPGASAVLADPMLVSGDYHLQPGSPCIDAGTATSPLVFTSDFDGDPRRLNTTPDVGADELNDVSHVVSAASLGLPVVQYDVNAPPGTMTQRGYSMGTGNILITEGNFLLDLGSLTILDPAAVPVPAAGTLILPISIAGLPPSVIGTVVYSQAVVFGATGGRLTNMVTTIICP